MNTLLELIVFTLLRSCRNRLIKPLDGQLLKKSKTDPKSKSNLILERLAQDWAILQELEIREGHDPELGWQAKQRLESLHSLPLGDDVPAPRHTGNQQDHFNHSVDGVAANGMP